jgi:hypothetical protein
MPWPLFSFSPLYFTSVRAEKQPLRTSFAAFEGSAFAGCNDRAKTAAAAFSRRQWSGGPYNDLACGHCLGRKKDS